MKKKFKYLCLLFITLVLSACSFSNTNTAKDPIIVGGLNTTEGLIMTHLVAQMIEHYIDTDVELLLNMGTSPMLNAAMVQGDANVAATKYVGTSLTSELGMDPITDPDLAFETVVKGFAEEFNQKWYPGYGFENSYAFLVTQEAADEYNLTKISDLQGISEQLDAGVDSSWMEREGDGYRAFVETYQMDFNNIYPMQIGLVYDAVESGELDIVLGYSTDGRIASYDLVVLEDDLNFFPPYDASPSANEYILEQYPLLDEVLYKLVDTIPTEMMQQLNYISDDYLLEPANVARRFLEKNNYFEDHEPYLEPIDRGTE